jgi:hypothetical protein
MSKIGSINAALLAWGGLGPHTSGLACQVAGTFARSGRIGGPKMPEIKVPRQTQSELSYYLYRRNALFHV